MSKLTQTEYNFLLLLRSALADRVAEVGELTAGVEVNDILLLAYNHKLRHMILSAIPEELLPDNVDRRSELIHRVAAQVGTTTAFLELWKSMERAGFRPIVVKGIICRSLYPYPELRPSGDEDLYISDDEFEGCCAFLQSLGLTPDKVPFSDYGEIGWRGENGIYIELHRDLFEGDALNTLKEFFNFDTLPKETYTTHYGIPVVSMAPHDHFLYLLLHAYKHFIHSGFGIRQVCDIGIWAQRYGDRIDWQKLSEQCDSARIKNFVIALLGIAKHELKIDLCLPEGWEGTADYCRPMLKDILCGGIYGSADADRLHSVTITLNAVEASRTEAKHSIRRSVFPTKKALQGRYPYVKKYPILLPVAWFSRIFAYAKRNASGETHAAQSIAIGKERIELLSFYDILD